VIAWIARLKQLKRKKKFFGGLLGLLSRFEIQQNLGGYAHNMPKYKNEKVV
jgi:hypothetical protein